MAAYTTINDPESYFKAVLYTGNETADTSITTGFDTDFTWIKVRETAGTANHSQVDSVRGVTKVIHSNLSIAEETISNAVTAFTSTGFTLGDDSGGYGFNEDGKAYVCWNWKESATAGFDIVSYTGNGSARTISHSLSAVPHLMIFKNRDDAQAWSVYHHKNTSAPATDRLILSTTEATYDDSIDFNDTDPTSSVFSVGTGNRTNMDGDNLIAYLFSEKQGFSKFGVFTGNGNADGPFCFCGFKPAFIIIKKSSATGPWIVFDNKRPFQTSDFEKPRLVANATGTDTSSFLGLDFLANGFKLRETDTDVNGSGVTYLFIAFAESPLVNSEEVPNNAQ